MQKGRFSVHVLCNLAMPLQSFPCTSGKGKLCHCSAMKAALICRCCYDHPTYVTTKLKYVHYRQRLTLLAAAPEPPSPMPW